MSRVMNYLYGQVFFFGGRGSIWFIAIFVLNDIFSVSWVIVN